MHVVYPRKFCITIVHFFFGITVVLREIADNGYANFGWVNKVHYGPCENGELHLGNLFPRAFVLSCPAERARDSVE